MNLLLGPLILTTNLILFLGGEVILDIEGFADFFWGLALDHIGNGLAADVEESLNVEIIGSLCRDMSKSGKLDKVAESTYQDDLEQHFLVHLHKLLVPLFDVGSLLARIGVIIVCRRGVTLVVDAPFDYFVEDCFVDLQWYVSLLWRLDEGLRTCVGNGNGLGHSLFAYVLHHILDEHGALGNITICIRRQQSPQCNL